MAGELISRRELFPGLALGATAALTGACSLYSAGADAQVNRQFRATAGPGNLRRGQTMVYQFFLPASADRNAPAQEFTLTLKTLDGRTLVTHTFRLRPGTGTQVVIALRDDGSLTLNGVVVPEARTSYLVVIAIIAILIGLLLPAVQKVRGTASALTPARTVEYALPFLENP